MSNLSWSAYVEWEEDCGTMRPTRAGYERWVADGGVVASAEKEAARLEKHGEAIAAAKAEAKKNKLPRLTGTAKQKDWAEQLRQGRMHIIGGSEIALKLLTSSKFWIDSRRSSDADFAKLVRELEAAQSEVDEAHKAAKAEVAAEAEWRKTPAAEGHPASFIPISLCSARLKYQSAQERPGKIRDAFLGRRSAYR